MASQSYTRTRRTTRSWADRYANQQWGKPAQGGLPRGPRFPNRTQFPTKQQQAKAYAETQAKLQATKQQTQLMIALALGVGFVLWRQG